MMLRLGHIFQHEWKIFDAIDGNEFGRSQKGITTLGDVFKNYLEKWNLIWLSSKIMKKR